MGPIHCHELIQFHCTIGCSNVVVVYLKPWMPYIQNSFKLTQISCEIWYAFARVFFCFLIFHYGITYEPNPLVIRLWHFFLWAFSFSWSACKFLPSFLHRPSMLIETTHFFVNCSFPSHTKLSVESTTQHRLLHSIDSTLYYKIYEDFKIHFFYDWELLYMYAYIIEYRPLSPLE